MSKLPTPAKLGLLAAATLLALVAGWLLLIGPKRSETKKLAGEIAETRQAIASAQGASATPSPAPTIRVADLFKMSRAMPNTADVPGLLLQLSRVAAETGVNFESITPHDPVPGTGYQQISVDLVFEGRFYDLSDFLFRLRNFVSVHNGVLHATGRLFSVDSISFDQGTLHFPQVKAALTVSAYLYGDGTAPPVPVGEAAAATTSPTTPATADSQPIPAAPLGATAAGA